MAYLLDTNICIYLIKGMYPAILDRIENEGIEAVSVSTITVAELEYGISKSKHEKRERNREALIEFLLPFRILDFTHTDACEYGRVRAELERKGTLVGNMDLLIGAQSRARNLTLVTNNEREFLRIACLNIENWTS